MKWPSRITGNIAILLLLTGCAVVSDQDNAKGGLSHSKVTLEFPAGVSLKPNGQLQSDTKNDFAAKITSIDLAVTASDMTTVTQNIPLATLETTLDIPSGSARTFGVVVATDAGMTFTGSQTVDLVPGAFVDVTISIGVSGLAPTGVSATAGIAQVTLAWNAVPGATSYNIYWSNSAGVTPSTGNKISVVTNSYTHTALTQGAQYYYVVTAVNASGETAASSEVSAITLASPPSAPAGVAATPGDTVNTVTWNAVTGATSYNIYWSTTSGVTTATGTKISAVSSPYVHTGLTNGTAYYYIVTAVNAGGESAASSQISVVPILAVPGAPTGITATGGNGQVTLSWTAPVGTVSSYNVYYRTASGVTTANGTKVAGATSGSAITGLTNGTSYYFVVTAVNTTGESTVSSEVSATPQVPAPVAPTGIGATAGNGQAVITWSVVTGATSYNIYYGIASGVTVANGTKVAGATPGGSIPLINGSTYYFVVTAVNAGGESVVSSEVSATPQVPAPGVPGSPSAIAGSAQVSLSWTAVTAIPNATITYTVYRSTTSGTVGPSIATSLGATSYTDSTVVNGTAYYYSVAAVDAGGTSAVSGQVSATPQPPIPGAPRGVAVAGGNGQVTLSWTAPVGTVSNYNVYYRASSGVTIANGTVGASGTASTSATITGLTNGTTYYFIVTAVNGGGEGAASGEVAGRPGLPGPTGIAATPAGSGATKVSWSPMGNTVANISGSSTVYNISGSNTAVYISGSATPVSYGSYRYRIYWSTATGVTPFNAVGNFGDIYPDFYEHTGLTNGTTYYYIVTAIDPLTGLETLPSAEASAIAGGEYWTAKGNMPVERSGGKSVELNAKIYLIGGADTGNNFITAVDVYDPVTGAWSTAADLPASLQNMGVASVNGKIYAIGGASAGAVAVNTVYAYDPVTNTWTAKASMPTARWWGTAAVVGGKIYVIGGNTGCCAWVPTVEVYDPATDTWVTKTSMPTSRSGATFGVLNGDIYVIGGWTGTQIATVERYSTSGDTWTTVASLPNALNETASVSLNGKIYTMGGSWGFGSGYFDSLYEYDSATNTWGTKAAMSSPRSGLMATVVNGKIYAFGGWVNNGTYTSSIEAYIPAVDAASNTWSYKSSMSIARQELALCALNGKIYAIVGYNGSFLSSMEEYDTATGTWTNCGTPAPGNGCPAMSIARASAVCEATGGQIHVMGGYDGASYLSNGETYDPTTNTWSAMGTSMSSARYSAASAELNGKAYVMGGRPTGVTYSNAMDIFDYTGPPVNQWTSGGSFANGRYFAGAGSYGGKLFLFGGNGGATYSDIQAYDPITASWGSTGNMPAALYGFGISELNGLFYLSGGSNGIGQSASYAYDPTTNTWKTIAAMSTTRWYHKSVAVNGKVYVVGGAESGAPAATLLEYTP